jgi:hypothetical protein
MSNGRPGEGRPLESNRELEQARDSSPAAPPATHRKTSRTHSGARSTLPAPVTISEWWRDRSGRSIRVSLNTYKGLREIEWVIFEAEGPIKWRVV